MFRFLRKPGKKEAKALEDCLAESGLPFNSREEAEAFFFAQRDNDLRELSGLNDLFPELTLDYKAGSLKRIEQFYFELYVDKSGDPQISKERMEALITQYNRQVFVANEVAEWRVFENDFAEGRYDLGLLYGYGSGTTQEYASDLDQKENNADRQYLYNNFMLYVPENRQKEVQ